MQTARAIDVADDTKLDPALRAALGKTKPVSDEDALEDAEKPDAYFADEGQADLNAPAANSHLQPGWTPERDPNPGTFAEDEYGLEDEESKVKRDPRAIPGAYSGAVERDEYGKRGQTKD